jgi:Sec-independent protein translocase protein TatA
MEGIGIDKLLLILVIVLVLWGESQSALGGAVRAISRVGRRAETPAAEIGRAIT